jgi:hypothetical protein
VGTDRGILLRVLLAGRILGARTWLRPTSGWFNRSLPRGAAAGAQRDLVVRPQRSPITVLPRGGAAGSQADLVLRPQRGRMAGFPHRPVAGLPRGPAAGSQPDLVALPQHSAMADRVARNQRVPVTKPPTGPRVQKEDQLYVQEPSAHLSCSVHMDGESPSPVGIRSLISWSGRLVPVCELAQVECSAPVCVSASILSIRSLCFQSIGITTVAFERGSRLGELDPCSFGSGDLTLLCVPAAVESFGDRGTFSRSFRSLTFELGS